MKRVASLLDVLRNVVEAVATERVNEMRVRLAGNGDGLHLLLLFNVICFSSDITEFTVTRIGGSGGSGSSRSYLIFWNHYSSSAEAAL
jgi:hypothetical protein